MADVAYVDAFARRAGEGNRAAVLQVDAVPPADEMAALARELAEPITVFAAPGGEGRWRLRWFAPSGELRSCGHGTVAAAELLLPPDDGAGTVFDTALGPLPVRRCGEEIEIGMPAEPLIPWRPGDEVERLLGAQVVDAVRSPRHGLVEVADPAAVTGLAPDLDGLAALPVVGLAVTARTGGAPPYEGHDIVSRWFVPRLGLEDQATGTAHCLLAPYWAARGLAGEIRARQASANGADIGLRPDGERVWLRGGAVRLAPGAVRPAGGHREAGEGRRW